MLTSGEAKSGPPGLPHAAQSELVQEALNVIDNVILAKRCGGRRCVFSREAGVARDGVGWGATARVRGSNIYRVSERDREEESGAYSGSIGSVKE